MGDGKPSRNTVIRASHKAWTRRALALLGLAALVAGCASAPPAAPAAQSATAAPTPTPGPPQLRDLAAARGLYVGAAVALSPLRTEPEYARLLGQTYNQLTAEDAMKFAPIHPARDRYYWDSADELMAFAEAHGMRVHGHALVWHERLPAWVLAGDLTRETARAALRDHIAQVVGRYKGRIAAWDVVNEAIAEDGSPRQTPWLKLIGPEYIELAFRWAHEADPAAKLFYNDYGGEDLNRKSDAIYKLVGDLKRSGVPIDGVGLQSHFSLAGRPDTAALAANIRRLNDLGLTVHISELDVRLPLPAGTAALKSQGRAYREILQVCLQAASCTEFTTWGFTDAHSWIPGFYGGYGAALPFDEQYAPKPAYGAMMEALRAKP
jgi:endo-1,4-beta-xylanase